MHRLVQDELLGRGAAQAAQANRSRLSQFRGGPGGQYGQQYHRANGVASSALSGPKRRSRSQADYMSDGSERYIVTHRKKHKKVHSYITYVENEGLNLINFPPLSAFSAISCPSN